MSPARKPTWSHPRPLVMCLLDPRAPLLDHVSLRAERVRPGTCLWIAGARDPGWTGLRPRVSSKRAWEPPCWRPSRVQSHGHARAGPAAPQVPMSLSSHGLSDASGEGSWPLHELEAMGQSGPIGKGGLRTQMLWSEGGTTVSLLGDLGPSLSLSAPFTRLSVSLMLVPARGVCRVTSDGTGRASAHGPPQ